MTAELGERTAEFFDFDMFIWILCKEHVPSADQESRAKEAFKSFVCVCERGVWVGHRLIKSLFASATNVRGEAMRAYDQGHATTSPASMQRQFLQRDTSALIASRLLQLKRFRFPKDHPTIKVRIQVRAEFEGTRATCGYYEPPYSRPFLLLSQDGCFFVHLG